MMKSRTFGGAQPGRRVPAATACVLAALILAGGGEANALPKEGEVAAGNSTISQPDATTLHINQATTKSIINWQGYSINANERVRYFQPGSSSISLNRVLGVDPSHIHGRLSANGQVWVINPNGLIVGSGARINVGSFLGSTLNIANEDFMNGNYRFTASPSLKEGKQGGIVNMGDITAHPGGYVVLISRSVSNEGTVSSPLGKSYLGSGDQVTLNFAGDDLLGFTIDKAAADGALGVINTGAISATGGEVILSARAAGDLLKTVINNQGLIEARTIENKNGVIRLLGDMENSRIEVGGILDGSAPDGGDGGFVETSAAQVRIADGAVVTTLAPHGKIGTWLIDPTDYVVASSGGDITGSQLSTNLGTSNVTVQTSAEGAGNGDIFVNDPIAWSANTILTLQAHRNIAINHDITASGDAAGLVLTPGGSYSLNTGKLTLSGSNPSLSIAGRAYTVINDIHALQSMSANLAGTYALGSDINASGVNFVPVGPDQYTRFTGTFDGLGHVIRDFSINSSSIESGIGLFGFAAGANIRNVGIEGGSVSYATNHVGGLAGHFTGGNISNCYSTASVRGDSNVGGLVGYFSGTMSNSYATGAVTGNYYVGGLVGYWYNYGGSISNSYATGPVSGLGYVGGLAGDYKVRVYSYFTNSYWDLQTSGQPKCTSWGDCSGSTGLATAQMKQQGSFTGWDFTSRWGIDEGVSSPHLVSFANRPVAPPAPPPPTPEPTPALPLTPEAAPAPATAPEPTPAPATVQAPSSTPAADTGTRENREGLGAGSTLEQVGSVVDELTPVDFVSPYQPTQSMGGDSVVSELIPPTGFRDEWEEYGGKEKDAYNPWLKTTHWIEKDGTHTISKVDPTVNIVETTTYPDGTIAIKTYTFASNEWTARIEKDGLVQFEQRGLGGVQFEQRGLGSLMTTSLEGAAQSLLGDGKEKGQPATGEEKPKEPKAQVSEPQEPEAQVSPEDSVVPHLQGIIVIP